MGGLPGSWGAAVCPPRRHANNMDRTGRMAHNPLGDAAQEQPVEPTAAMRSHHDDIGLPRARRIDDGVPRIGIRCRNAYAESLELELCSNALDHLTRAFEARLA